MASVFGASRMRSLWQQTRHEGLLDLHNTDVQLSQTEPRLLSYPACVTQGLIRFYGGRDLHFLTFSYYRRRPFFERAELRDLFLEILERVRRRYRLVVLGYVVIPEHVHLLVSEPQRDTLSTVVQALKLGFVRALERSKIGAAVPRSRKIGETWGTPFGVPEGSSQIAGIFRC